MRGILGIFTALGAMLTFAGLYVAQLGVKHSNLHAVGGGLAAAAGGALLLFGAYKIRR